jgi:hypothetical protein
VAGKPRAVGVAGTLEMAKLAQAVPGQGSLAPLQPNKRTAVVRNRLKDCRPGAQFALLIDLVEQAKRTSPDPQERRCGTSSFVDERTDRARAGGQLAKVKAGSEHLGGQA